MSETAKATLRAQYAARRAARSAAELARVNALLTDHLPRSLAEVSAADVSAADSAAAASTVTSLAATDAPANASPDVTAGTALVVAAYVPVRGEPGSLDLLDRLAARARVLLPVTGEPGTALQWAQYAGRDHLVRGPFGIRQPPASDGSLLASAGIVLVPAVAVGLDGSRLGHGGGYYDRSLAGIPRERLVGVVHDDEVADSLPTDAHDVRLGWLCTPTRWEPIG